MSFIESPRLPSYFSYGATGGAEYHTTVPVLDSGVEQGRNVDWDQPRSRYTVAMPLEKVKATELIGWFHAMRGKAHGFRMKDWSDFTVDLTTGRLGTSPNGTGGAVYQLTKLYTVGSLSQYRNIRKPVAGQVAIYRGGVLQTVTTHYTIDTTTGMVTFIGTPPSFGETLAWVGQFDIPVRFDTDYQGLSKTNVDFYNWDGLQLVELRT